MSAWDTIYGQDQPVSVLRRALANDRLSSAYLFEGPSGVGKERVALALAAEAMACGSPEIEARVLAGNHPDLRVFRPREDGKGNIKVELVRSEILPFTQYAPFEAERAFVVFPEADVSFPESQPESANALLKTLEEPRRGVCFLLLAERPDRLLPTIRSRCQRVRFGRLPADALDHILAANGVPEEERGPASALAEGRADRALALATDGHARVLLEGTLELDDALLEHRPGLLLERADQLAKSADVGAALETLALYYHDLACLCVGASPASLRFRHALAELRPRARRHTPESALRCEALVRGALRTLEGQANPQIALDALLYQLGGARSATAPPA